tara:strand:+ start:242 stop:487 length:246 start_codon:yes stop_codon:yes gene_type:complete
MLLNEFLYFEKDTSSPRNNDRYDSDRDSSVLKSKDLRKSRLTLGMLNDLRKAGDAREKETKEDLELVRVMYATPVEEAPAQ